MFDGSLSSASNKSHNKNMELVPFYTFKAASREVYFFVVVGDTAYPLFCLQLLVLLLYTGWSHILHYSHQLSLCSMTQNSYHLYEK